MFNPSNVGANFIQSTRMQKFRKPFKPYHVGIHWKALTEYSQISTHVPWFQSFFRLFASLCIGQISSIKVKPRLYYGKYSVRSLFSRELWPVGWNNRLDNTCFNVFQNYYLPSSASSSLFSLALPKAALALPKFFRCKTICHYNEIKQSYLLFFP